MDVIKSSMDNVYLAPFSIDEMNKLAKMKELIKEQEQMIASLKSSLSWRLTSPLRYILDRFLQWPR
jgi:hypothetical protein